MSCIHDMFASHSCSRSVWPLLAANTELASRCRTGWAAASGSRMHTMGYCYYKHAVPTIAGRVSEL